MEKKETCVYKVVQIYWQESSSSKWSILWELYEKTFTAASFKIVFKFSLKKKILWVFLSSNL